MSDAPSISVVIPAYNAETFLSRAIESVLAQTFPPSEIIVVDDGSSDRTGEVARRFGERIRYIWQENGGASAARNRGVIEARGEWIAFLDADDWWEPMRLAWQVEILERHPELVWVSGGITSVWAGGERTVHPESTRYLEQLQDGCYFPDFYEAAVAGVIFSTILMLIRRRVILEVGLFDTEMEVAMDNDLWYRIADRYPAIGYVDRPAAFYDRTTEGSLVKVIARRPPSVWRLLTKHMPEGSWEAVSAPSSKQRHFAHVVRKVFRQMILAGQTVYVRRMLSVYGAFLSPAMRFVGRVAGMVPPKILAAIGRWYCRTIGPLRRHRARA